MKKYTALLLIFSIIVSITFCSFTNTTADSQSDDIEDIKVTTNVSLDQDFSPDKVIVTIKKNYSKINKKYRLSDFTGLEIESIRDLTEIIGDVESKTYFKEENFRQIICITLKKKTKANVLSAIKRLEKLPMVRSAEPNYIYNITDFIESNNTENLTMESNVENTSEKNSVNTKPKYYNYYTQ